VTRCACAALAVLFMVPATAFGAAASVDDGKLVLQATGEESISLVPAGDKYYVRRNRSSPTMLAAGRGCFFNAPRELRCTGDIRAIDVHLLGDRFSAERLRVPLTITGGVGDDSIQIGNRGPLTFGSNAPVSIQTGAGKDSVAIVGEAGVQYVVDGGPGKDLLTGQHVPNTPSPSFTLRGGAGDDTITGDSGADELDGGTGTDTLAGNGGSDTILGGPGIDTAVVVPQREAPVTITLDGRRNDGAPGEEALMGSDIENVTLSTAFAGGPVEGNNTLVGDEGPNVLVGAGTVRGLGGDDVISAAGAGVNDLDGGDGNDRISARVYDEFTQYVVADKIGCGNGDDVLFSDRLDPRPAGCERFNLGLHVAAATAPVGAGGWAAVRVKCTDVVPCELGAVTLTYKKHRANEYSEHRGPRLAPGQSAVFRVRLNRWLRRPGRFGTLAVTAMPEGAAGGLYAGFPRVITLKRG
jgi:hypothetical protein